MVNFFRSTMSTMLNAITVLYTKEKRKSNITISTPALGFYVFNHVFVYVVFFVLLYILYQTCRKTRHQQQQEPGLSTDLQPLIPGAIIHRNETVHVMLINTLFIMISCLFFQIIVFTLHTGMTNEYKLYLLNVKVIIV